MSCTNEPLSVEEIEAYFLDHDGPYFEQILEEATFDKAMAIACKATDNAPGRILLADLRAVVKNIRRA